METRKRILIVDDDAQNRELLEALLAELGHDVDVAEHGYAALTKLDASHDLILLDVMMAGVDGFEVARRIRAESPFFDVPICMVTALSGREERLRGVEAGANDFISKPIDKIELRVRTASLLKAKQAQDQAKKYRTELEESNQLLRDKYEQVRLLSEQKEEFVRIASHDLKNPLMCIKGFSTIIEKSLLSGASASAPETSLHHLSRINHNVSLMQTIINDYLDFQAIEDGRIQFNSEQVSLNSLALQALDQNAGHAVSKQISLESELDSDLPSIQADSSRIAQVISNLLGNAIKFSEYGSRVKILTRLVESSVVLEIRDWGPGLTEGDLQSLFVKYAQLSNKPSGGETSTGLGLSICKKMVELQGGEIGAHNNSDGGTTFWFKFPAHVLANA